LETAGSYDKYFEKRDNDLPHEGDLELFFDVVVIIHRFTKLLAMVGIIIQKKMCQLTKRRTEKSPSFTVFALQNQGFRSGYIKGLAV
jgi:hypothetical protein